MSTEFPIRKQRKIVKQCSENKHEEISEFWGKQKLLIWSVGAEALLQAASLGNTREKGKMSPINFPTAFISVQYSISRIDT